jgi:hypothetical protein
LTAQEGELREEQDEDDQEGPDNTFEQASIDRLRLQRIRSSASPKSGSPSLIPRRSSSRLDLMASTENKENVHEEHTNGTGVSKLSFLEEGTDDSIGMKLRGHAMDQQRLERAKRRESPAFAGGSNRTPRLTVEALQRRNDSYGDQVQTNGTPTGSVSERSDIPLNVPKSWGSKNMVSKDWLSRPNNRKALNSPSPVPHDGSPASGIDWAAAAADTPIPSIENSYSPVSALPQGSTPMGNARKNPSLDRVREWELDADFTARSLQVSNSPPVRLRSSALDEIRGREIEDLEKKAVTTNRLGEIHKRASNELLRKRSPTPKIEQEPGLVRKTSRNFEPALPEKEDSIVDDKSSFVEEEENHVPDVPVVVYKSPQNTETKDVSHHSSNGSNLTVKGEDKRAENDLHDSQELLRQLARATSTSPAPPAENWTFVDEEGNSQNAESAKEEKHKESQDDVNEPWVPDATPAPEPMNQETYSKTPIVTGAWIDTPMPTGRRQSIPSKQEPKDTIPDDLTKGIEETVTRPKSQRPVENRLVKANEIRLPHPSLPKSALEAVIDGVKKRKSKDRQNESLVITEDTIESLEELLGLSDDDMSTILKFPKIDFDPSITRDILDSGPKSDREREHLNQMALYARLNSRLQLLRHSIHDAKNGISKLEYQVSATDSVNHPLQRCLDCGCPRSTALVLHASTYSKPNALYIPLYIPTPRLWRRVPNQRLPCITRLGWIVLSIWVWTITEAYLAHWYSPHFSRNPFREPNFPIRWDAPVYPYVTVTKLYEWSGVKDVSSIIRPLWSLLRMVVVMTVRVIAQTIGWGDGFVDDAPGDFPVSMDDRIPKPDYAPDFSMMGDEYL